MKTESLENAESLTAELETALEAVTLPAGFGVDVELTYEGEDGWCIPPWKARHAEPEDIAKCWIVVRIFAEADDRRFAELADAAEFQASRIVAAAKELGIELNEQQGEIRISGGGTQINLQSTDFQ